MRSILGKIRQSIQSTSVGYRLRISIVFFYILMSHVFLEHVFERRDVLFFARWDLFSDGAREYFFDLVWQGDNGEEMFLSRSVASTPKVDFDTITLFRLVQDQRWNAVSNRFGARLKRLCQCEKIEAVKLLGSYGEHIIYEKSPVFSHRIELP